MCKESMQADTCPRCGRRMYYAEQHLAVCDAPVPVKRERTRKADAGKILQTYAALGRMHESQSVR